MVWGAVGSIFGGLANTALDYWATQNQLRGQMKLQKNYQNWAERMSNTAFQRQKSDLLKAGYNPLMALGAMGGGASTPSSSIGNASKADLSDFGKGISGANDKYLQTKQVNSAVGLTKEQTETEKTKQRNLDANTALQESQKIMQDIHNKFTPDKYKAELRNIASEINKNVAMTAEITSAKALNEAQKELTNLQSKTENENKKYIEAKTRYEDERSRGYTISSPETWMEFGRNLWDGYNHLRRKSH